MLPGRGRDVQIVGDSSVTWSKVNTADPDKILQRPANMIDIWRFLLGACGLKPYLHVRKNTAIIMLKVLGASTVKLSRAGLVYLWGRNSHQGKVHSLFPLRSHILLRL
jgi:hypothetical protein